MRSLPDPRLALAVAVLALAAGCDERAPGDERDRRKAETVVAALGDSITAGAPAWDPNPALRAEIAPDPRSQYEYWAERRLRGTRFRNCGVSGERTDQIAARLERCARGSHVLIVQGGVNDIAQRRPIEAAARNLRRMVRRAKKLHLRVALVELLPWNTGYPAADGPIRELNAMIRDIARQERVRLFRWYRRLEDPARPGRMRAEWTAEGIHPSIAGYRRLGEVVELP